MAKKTLQLQPTQRRSMCNNCGGWREQHYNQDGSWNEGLECSEYDGRDPFPDEVTRRDADLKAHFGATA